MVELMVDWTDVDWMGWQVFRLPGFNLIQIQVPDPQKQVESMSSELLLLAWSHGDLFL